MEAVVVILKSKLLNYKTVVIVVVSDIIDVFVDEVAIDKRKA